MKKIIYLISILLLSNQIITAQNWGEQILNHPNEEFGNSFGFSVAIDDNYAVIGTPGDGNAGLNENEGTVQIFKKNNNGVWAFHQELKNFNPALIHGDKYLGNDVAIEGDFIFVACHKERFNEVRYEGVISGAVLIFKKDNNDVWQYTQKLRSSDLRVGDAFGESIDVSGNFLVIGAPYNNYDKDNLNLSNNSGAAYVFKKNVNDTWSQIQKITANNRVQFDNFGRNVSIHNDFILITSLKETDDAGQVINGRNGNVHLFKKDGAENWNFVSKIKPNNRVNNQAFGYNDIDIFGDYIAVSAIDANVLENGNFLYGALYIFKKENENWNQHQIIRGTTTSDKFGYSLSLDNNVLLVSAPYYDFTNNDGSRTNEVGISYLYSRGANNQYQLAQSIETSDKIEGGRVGYSTVAGLHQSFDAIAIKNNQFIIGASRTKRRVDNIDRFDFGNVYISGNIENLIAQTITWTGAVSTDWNTPGNWDANAVPIQNDDVIIADVANAPKINFNQSYAVNNLTINDALTIKNNASLTVNGDLDQGSNIQVESFVNGNGSFILRGNQTNVNPADLIYLRYVSGNNWHLFSSPSTSVDIDILAAATQLAEGQNNNRGIGFYNNNANPNWSYYQNGAVNSGDFIAGKGYSIRTSANAFLNFTGKLKADNLTNYPITENLNGWNLIGNPYPAYINANVNADANENFLTENTDNLDPLFANIYLWNPNTTSYEPVGNGLGAKYIAPGQAFFVKSKNGGGSIDINKSMLTHQLGNLFLKGNQPQKIVLKIDDKTNVAETTIAFKNGMTKGLDVTYDASVFNGESRDLSLYTHLLESDKKTPFAIQFLPELENSDFVIPLGIEKNQDREITISLKESTISSDVKIYLEDKKEGTFIEISNDVYKFSHYKEAPETGRFFLHIQQKSLSVDNDNITNLNIYKGKNGTIYINGISDGLLDIYSIKGQKIIENYQLKSLSEKVYLPKLSKGIYLINIKNKKTNFTKKLLF
ncbi:MAG: FG-GAP repeat protein [Polaribacter sp.]